MLVSWLSWWRKTHFLAPECNTDETVLKQLLQQATHSDSRGHSKYVKDMAWLHLSQQQCLSSAAQLGLPLA